jgi:hypothetical protein
MTHTITGTYSTLITIGSPTYNPTTIVAAAMLNDGLLVSYQGLAVVNAGHIAGPTNTNESFGVHLTGSGSVTNQSGGSISGYDGIYGYSGPLTVVNAGSITGSFLGVDLGRGALTVINQTGGWISARYAIDGGNAAATVVNAGSIVGTRYGEGVFLFAGGSVTNQSGGVISGYEGIFAEGAMTVVDAGTITGSTDAVEFAASFANRLVIDPSAVLSGQVTGGNAIGAAHVSTLELASAGSAGTLSGLGTQFVDFAQVTVDAHARWTLTATNTIAAGATLTNAGTLTDAGTLTNAGTLSGALTLAAAGMLLNASTGTITAPDGTAVLGATGGAATIVNAGLITGTNASGGHGIDLTAGGNVTNQSSGAISGNYGIYGKGAAVTVVNAGTITGSTDAVSFAAGFADRLIADPGAVFAGKVKGGGGVVELASAASAGTLSGFGTSITNFGSLQFDAGAAWTVSGTSAASGLGTIAITGFADNDTIDLTGFVAVSDTFANNALVLTDASNHHATLAIQGTFAPGAFQIPGDGNGGTDVIVCFAAGTQIGTSGGEVPVEQLQVGELVLTAHNGLRRIVWIGQGKVLATRGRRTAATPVIVRKGALADNVPNRDLHVTKAHSFYIDNVLIPAEFLVNHRTILWDDRAGEVEIYHIELDSHDVLIANGAPAESFRDDGNRWLFQNARSGWDLPPQEPYAPVLTGGRVVDEVWQRLLDRAGPHGLSPLTDDADLYLLVDGMRVEAREQSAMAYIFRLPSYPKSVVIGSRAAAPAELGFARDPRSLGVALQRVTIRQGSKFMLIDASDERLTAGFHDYEPAENIRWTYGYAELPIQAFARFDEGAEVTIHLGGSTRYRDDGDEAGAHAAYAGTSTSRLGVADYRGMSSPHSALGSRRMLEGAMIASW